MAAKQIMVGKQNYYNTLRSSQKAYCKYVLSTTHTKCQNDNLCKLKVSIAVCFVFRISVCACVHACVRACVRMCVL